jgi:hypothetical protein
MKLLQELKGEGMQNYIGFGFRLREGGINHTISW